MLSLYTKVKDKKCSKIKLKQLKYPPTTRSWHHLFISHHPSPFQIPVAYILSTETGLNLFQLIIAISCELTAKHGISPFSANACACFSGVLSQVSPAISQETFRFSFHFIHSLLKFSMSLEFPKI